MEFFGFWKVWQGDEGANFAQKWPWSFWAKLAPDRQVRQEARGLTWPKTTVAISGQVSPRVEKQLVRKAVRGRAGEGCRRLVAGRCGRATRG